MIGMECKKLGLKDDTDGSARGVALLIRISDLERWLIAHMSM